ncbi:hypothetical protein [Ruthenibacterium lactatiformans]|jgi:hypothetical protein|uniref:hypothetical protein n=1 Tax=Ruthenibacterium lactatiformans TaxID=1550024 RepID=UPI003AEF3D3F
MDIKTSLLNLFSANAEAVPIVHVDFRRKACYDKSKEKRCGEVFLHRSFFGDAFARYNGPPHPFASL